MLRRISEDLSPGSLPARLRALPAFTAPAGGWARLDARLAARRRRFVALGGGFAMAASVLVAVGLSTLRPEPATLPGAAGAARPEVARLIDRSQALERRLSSARPQVAVWSESRDARAALIEPHLRQVDAQINFAGSGSAERLWRERVALMNALVDVHQPEEPALHHASYQY
jgi:hypothetical protein